MSMRKRSPNAIRAAHAEAAVVLAVLGLRHGVLRERVAAPGRERVEAHLHDRIGALALLLRQRHDAASCRGASSFLTPVLTLQLSLSWNATSSS